MLKEKRFEVILKKIEEHITVTYEQLAVMLHVSEDTVRRDIDYLHKNGLLKKVRGGAMLRSKDPLSFQDRTTFATEEKNLIALKAQKFISPGTTIFMDGGTTICAIVKQIPANVPIRIVSNNAALIPVVSQLPNIELIFLGGTYHKEIEITSGTETCQEAQNYLADIYFMGTCAVDAKMGATATYRHEAEVKRAMAKSAKKIIVLADQKKLQRTESFKTINLDQIDALITNLPSDDEYLNVFRHRNILIV